MTDKEILNTVLTSLKGCLTVDLKDKEQEVVIKDIIKYIEEKRHKQKKILDSDVHLK